MLLLTSSASSIVYAQLGDTPWDWATVMLPMAFAATLAGQVRAEGAGCLGSVQGGLAGSVQHSQVTTGSPSLWVALPVCSLGCYPSELCTPSTCMLCNTVCSLPAAGLFLKEWTGAIISALHVLPVVLLQAAIDWLVRKVGRSSMVVLVLAAFFIVATCLSIYTMAGAVKAVATTPELLGRLGKICR